MEYKLALELKEAGFPQTGKGSWIGPTGLNAAYNGEWHNVYAPILEEVIEELGEDLRYLQRIENGGWVAGTYDTYESGIGLSDSNVWKGNTPLIAACNLYIALHTK